MFSLVPFLNVEPEGHPNTWRSLSDDPQFLVTHAKKLAAKWVFLEIQIGYEGLLHTPVTVYWDAGQGFIEANVLVLRPDVEGRACLLWRAPRRLRALRIDPCAQAGVFVKVLKLTPLSKQTLFGMALQRSIRDPGRLTVRMTQAWQQLRKGGGLNGLAEMIVKKLYPTAMTLAAQHSYAHWIDLYEPSVLTYPLLKTQAQSWPRQPLIAVLMPTYNTPDTWLRAAIESVRCQVYENWELCIADDASSAPHVRQMLQAYAKEDARIKVVFRERNGHISEASNSALEMVTASHVALFDHDDELHPLALYHTAQALLKEPDAEIIYSDEDKITETGQRLDPYFKSDFNYELLLSQNMISHLGVYKTDTVRALGGFRTAFNGSQDYDLALRVLDHCQRQRIVHLPHVLYHWRLHAASTAQGGDAKPYAHLAALAAIQSHFGRIGVQAEVCPAPMAQGCNKVRYLLPTPPSVDIVIPTRNAHALVEQCIRSILQKTTYDNYVITLVDNGSDDPDALRCFDALATELQSRLRLLRDDTPFNYSALNNAAVRSSTADFVCLMNNDIEIISPEWLEEMVSVAAQKGVGCVGARLLYPQGTLQHAGVLLGGPHKAIHAHKHCPKETAGYFGRAALLTEFSAVSAACLLVSRATYLEVGGLDEQLAVAYNDIDFCLRVGQAGYRNVFTPYAQLYHHESATRGHEDSPEKISRFQRESALLSERWAERLARDPFYSPNLTLDREDFSLAWPPRTAA